MKLEDFYINEREFYKKEIERSRKVQKRRNIMIISLISLTAVLYLIGLLFVLKVFSKPKDNLSINILATPFSSNQELKNTEIERVTTNAESDIPICDMNNVKCMITFYAIEYEIDYKIALSISIWETGNFTSDAYKYKNNVGGMMFWNGAKSELITYSTLQDGVIAFIKNLKTRYFNNGLDTLEKIQPIYCPVGAANDPNNINQYWLNGTKRIYESL